MHHPIDRIAHTTAFVTPVMEHWLEREIAQWLQPMKDRSNDPSHHELRSYHGATYRSLIRIRISIIFGVQDWIVKDAFGYLRNEQLNSPNFCDLFQG